jgi:hypothetical protein
MLSTVTGKKYGKATVINTKITWSLVVDIFETGTCGSKWQKTQFSKRSILTKNKSILHWMATVPFTFASRVILSLPCLRKLHLVDH